MILCVLCVVACKRAQAPANTLIIPTLKHTHTYTPTATAMGSQGSLARQMRELGVACTMDANALLGILRQSCAPGTSISEQDVAEVLMMMAQTQHAAVSSSSSGAGQTQEGGGEGGQQSMLAKTLAAIMNPSSSGSGASAGGKDQGGSGSGKGGKGGGGDSKGDPPGLSAASPAPGGWNWRTVMDVIKSAAPGLAWARVAELLDHPSFSIPDLSGFTLLATAYRHAAGTTLPARAFCGRVWDHHAGQLSFLRLAVAAEPELFSFHGCERMAQPLEGMEQAGKSPAGTPNEAWLSIDLLQVLCYLFVEPAHQPVVRLMLQTALNECPEVSGCACV